MNQLADSLKSNQIALRYIIQYEVLHKRPIMDSYLHFCTIVGDDAMSYPDFEFWYMRFSNGHLDANYERPADPLTLSKMPVEMVGKIVEKVDPANRIITRYVSKSLRSVVDSLNPNVKIIEYSIHENKSSIHLDRHEIVFTSENDECWMEYNNMKIKMEETNHIEEAFRATEGMLAHSELKLDNLSVFDGANMSLETVKLLKTPNKSIDTFAVIIETSNPRVRRYILKLMMPETLKYIDIRNPPGNPEFSVRNIMKTKQWKQVKGFMMNGGGLLSHDDLRIVHKLPVFRYKTSRFDMNDFADLRNTLRKSPNFVEGTIEQNRRIPFTLDQLSTLFGKDVEYDSMLHNINIIDPIPNSTDFLHFHFTQTSNKIYAGRGRR